MSTYEDMSDLCEACISIIDSRYDNKLPRLLWKEFHRIQHERAAAQVTQGDANAD